MTYVLPVWPVDSPIARAYVAAILRGRVAVTLQPPRAWILGRRLHHGRVGLILGLAATRLPAPFRAPLLAAAVALMADDWADRENLWAPPVGLPYA